MKNNFLVIPNNLDNINNLLSKDIKGLILPIEHLAIGSSFYVSIDKLKEIIGNKKDKDIYVLLNKSMENKDLDYLKEVLITLNNLDISGILFTDMAILNIANSINLEKELVIYQEHLNASIYSHKFFKKYLNTSFITSDITIDEIKEIRKESNMKIMYQVYGYLSIFYSRRYILSNYLKYINKEKLDNVYYLKHNDEYYPVLEEENGTMIYPKEEINLINEIDNLKELDYLVINGFNKSDLELDMVIEDFVNNKKNNKDNYLGFYNIKTIYKVKKS